MASGGGETTGTGVTTESANYDNDNFYVVDEDIALAIRRMQTFHSHCGQRITLSNGNRTATRSVRDFSHALVFSKNRLTDNVLFEVVIERKNNSWGGSIEIGVTSESPDDLELLPSATAMRNGTWVISGTEVRCNGECINGRYGVDLETLVESDRVGIMRNNREELIVYVNGESMGVADYHVPKPLWALVNLYGRCVQVSICPKDAIDNGAGDMNESTQQIVQSVDLPLSVDVSVTSSAGGTISTTSLVEAANSANLSLVNALAVARNLCSSLPPQMLFTRQQTSSNSNQSVSSGIGSSNTISSVVSTQSPSDFFDMNERLRFHTRCGSLVKLSTNFRSAERRRPLDEFNNGVVMTHRPLKDNELFEIRIDKLVDKWSGSIEVGVTTHNPTVLHFPATMTNMRSGTIMMSGCGILTNGKGTRRQYGEFNLDELAEGDRVGMMRKSNSNLHYYINGQDQGVAATRVASTLWGVIDLYGMTIKVTIVDRDEREQQNLVTRRNNLLLSTAATAAAAAATAAVAACASTSALSLQTASNLTPMLSLQSPDSEMQVNGIIGGVGDTSVSAINGAMVAASSLHSSNAPRNDDRLLFNPLCGSHARVTHSGRTALRPNASDDFNNGVVLTRRPLRPNELFQVRLERVVSKWAGSVEMGVTIYSAEELDFPFTMTNVRTGTWMMTGNGVMQNGITVIEQYGQNLDRLQVGDRVGVMRKDDGSLHFWVNGVDQGLAAIGVPERVYGVIDLYGQAAQASIVDTSECGSPDTGNSTISNTSLYSEPPLRFHSIHGKNANISSNGLTASRPNSLAEFNDSIVFSSRPLRQRELFEVVLENMVRHWSGNVEIGVTGTRPEDITISPNATDLEAPETIILCGAMLFYNRKTIRSNVPMDLDFLSANARVGVMRNGDFIHFYINGVDQGPACELRSPNVWAIVDLYGQCAQVSITQTQPVEVPRVAPYATSENSQSCQATSVIQPAALETKHRWTCVSGLVQLTQNWTVASRLSGTTSALTRCLVFSEHPLRLGSPFEIRILARNPMLAGSLSIGITDLNLSDDYVRRNLPVNIKRIPANVWYLTSNELRHNMCLLQRSATSLEWLRCGDRISLELTTGRTLRVLFNSEDMNIHFKHVAKNPYVVVELNGSTVAVRVISSQAPMSPLRPCILRLQDSLDFGADPLNKQDSMLESIESEVVSLEFMEHIGTNLRLQNDNRTVTRLSSFNNGIIFGSKAMCKGDCISIKIDKINPKWQGTIGVGVVGFCPLLLNTIPQSLLHLNRRCWGITKDYISINGQRISSNYGEPLDHIQVGTVITLTLTFTNMLIITVGGTTLEEVGTLPNLLYPVFDLYGKCEQITAIVMPSTDTGILNNGVSPPMASAPSVETAISTIAVSNDSTTTATAPTELEAVNGACIQIADDEPNSPMDIDPEHNLSREKADLECHEKETNENIEQPTTSAAAAASTSEHEAEVNDDDMDLAMMLHVSPASTNLNASMNRSVMESVSENLLTNLSIKIRSLGLQNNRQSEMNGTASNLPSCRLRESLQLHHNTNYNIQRSQSNQRLQQHQQNQQQQQQQQSLQNSGSGLSGAVNDTNKDYEALAEAENAAAGASIYEENSMQTHQSSQLPNSIDNNTTSNNISNNSRNRAASSFGAFLANEILNDSSSTSSTSIPTATAADDALIQFTVDAALNDGSSSSSRSSTRDIRPNVIRSNNLLDNLSLSSSDSFGSFPAVGGQSRLFGGPLRINDFLLDSSSDGSNDSENRQQISAGRTESNETNDDGFVTIMAMNTQWRAQSPIMEESPTAMNSVTTATTALDENAHDEGNATGGYGGGDSCRGSSRGRARGRGRNFNINLARRSAFLASNANENDDVEMAQPNETVTSSNANSVINSASSLDSLQSFCSVERRDCAYLKLVKRFFASLVLPKVFFVPSVEPLCFCTNCNVSGRTGLNNWVYYKLDTKNANAHELPSNFNDYEQYFCMYFLTRVDKIRAILDFGQLVPQESTTSDGEVHTPSSASGQKDEPGTRLELHFTPENVPSMRKNTHLRFKHNGKEYRIGAAFEVFVRHQALCSLPAHSLGCCTSNRSDLHSLDGMPGCSGSSTSLFVGLFLHGFTGADGAVCGGNGSGGGSSRSNVNVANSNNIGEISNRNSTGSGGGGGSGSGGGSSRSNVNVANSNNIGEISNRNSTGSSGGGGSGSGGGSSRSNVNVANSNNIGEISNRNNTGSGGGGGSACGDGGGGGESRGGGNACTNSDSGGNNAIATNRSHGSGRSNTSITNDNNGGGVASSSSPGSSILPLSSINSNTSVPELTWFTKEDGSCFINALVLRLEEYTGDELSLDSLMDEFN